MTTTPLAETTATTGSVRQLHDGWFLESVAGPVPSALAGRSIPATIPGSVHTDLLAAGIIDDPYLDDNERLQAWIGACDWRYVTHFDFAPDGQDRHDLVFEGIDTIASIELNGEHLASTRNMHRTYRFEVSALLRDGSNELVVTFASPVKAADQAALEQGYRPHVNHHPYNSIRKMACSFGWDWGPDTATSGLWRPVSLSSWSTARLAAVRPTVTVSGTQGTVSVAVEVEHASGPGVTVSARVGEVQASVELVAGQTSATLQLVVDDVDLWWPRSHGAQPLYDLDVTMSAHDATEGEPELDSWQGRIGFRTIRVDHTPDADGTPFAFYVNDEPVFIRGANWIPDDAFLHRVDRDRYAARLTQAEFANINLLRIWGGGIYEADDFYELCDERGILVWQDFLFACAAYSEEEPMSSEVEAEVRDNITRLMPHASLALWNGSNENIWGYFEWGWENRLGGKTWGLGYYHELLPELVSELDPARSYTPSSPFSPAVTSGDEHYPNDPAHGSMHIWELWNRQDYPHYRDYEPRFVGEFGWQGPPTWSTLTRSISDAPLTPVSPGMLVHQKAQDGNVKLIDGLVAHLQLPDDMQDWHFAMSLNQAVAVQTGIEYFRSLSPRCMGSVVWQLNDCWPVTSWAAVDGDGRAKPLLYSIKHAYADRLLTIQPRDGGLVLAVVNDSAEAWSGEVQLQRLAFDGSQLALTSERIEVASRGTLVLPIDPSVATPSPLSHSGVSDAAAAEVVVATLGDQRGLWFFSEYRDSALNAPQLSVIASKTEAGYAVSVTAANLVRDVALLVDRLDPDAVVDDQLVTLLPGESVTFEVATTVDIPIDSFSDPDVLRSANQLMTLRVAR